MPEKIGEPHLLSNDSRKEIQTQLNLILSSAPFSRSSVLSNFLKFIVKETLEGKADGLKEYTIAVSALGKPVDFNPQSDAIVRIHAGRLRRFLYEYYEGPGIADTLKIEVVKGTYVPVFRKQFINQVTVENTVDSVIEITADNNPVAYSRSRLTLAILPFRNLLPDDEYQFFVDGFGEELTRIFSASEEIAVVAHFSTLRYASQIEDIRKIGSDLGVHYVITGAVKRSSTKIRVSIGLVETMNGMQIWSKDYTHNLQKDQIMDIQDQINNDVFALLSGHYGFIVSDTLRSVEKELKQDLQTFDAILWYNHAQITHAEDNCLACKKAIESVLEKDPNNVMCLVILADLYLFCYSLGYTTVEDPVNQAHIIIKKALGIAPFSQFANLINAAVNTYLGKKNEAIEALLYSVQLAVLSPSSLGMLGYGFSCVGEYKRGRAFLQQALNLNPYGPWWYYLGFYFVSFHEKKYEEALAYAQKMYASDDVYIIPLLITAAKGQLGRNADAQSKVSLLEKKFPKILSNLKAYLSAFILDESLVDEIIAGAQKAGLTIV